MTRYGAKSSVCTLEESSPFLSIALTTSLEEDWNYKNERPPHSQGGLERPPGTKRDRQVPQ